MEWRQLLGRCSMLNNRQKFWWEEKEMSLQKDLLMRFEFYHSFVPFSALKLSK